MTTDANEVHSKQLANPSQKQTNAPSTKPSSEMDSFHMDSFHALAHSKTFTENARAMDSLYPTHKDAKNFLPAYQAEKSQKGNKRSFAGRIFGARKLF